MAKRASIRNRENVFATTKRKTSVLSTLTEAPQEGLIKIPVDDIRPDPNQPRKYFDEEGIKGLARSISEKGLFQPVVVTNDPEQAGKYVLVMGERRWRAHKEANIPDILAIVSTVTDPIERIEHALSENRDRLDLSLIEEAASLEYLRKEKRYTQRELGLRVNRSESQVSRILKLNRLSDGLKEKLVRAQISQESLFRIVEQKTPEKMHALADLILEEGYKRDQIREVAKDGEKTKLRSFKTRSIINKATSVATYLSRVGVADQIVGSDEDTEVALKRINDLIGAGEFLIERLVEKWNIEPEQLEEWGIFLKQESQDLSEEAEQKFSKAMGRLPK